MSVAWIESQESVAISFCEKENIQCKRVKQAELKAKASGKLVLCEQKVYPEQDLRLDIHINFQGLKSRA